MTNKTYIASTRVVSEMVTEHARKIGALGPDEKFRVLSSEGDELTTRMKGKIENDKGE